MCRVQVHSNEQDAFVKPKNSMRQQLEIYGQAELGSTGQLLLVFIQADPARRRVHVFLRLLSKKIHINTYVFYSATRYICACSLTIRPC